MQGKKVIETISFQTGFRSVEIKDTPAHERRIWFGWKILLYQWKGIKTQGC